MTSTLYPLIGIAALLAVSVWLSLRVTAGVNVDGLPTCCRGRMLWLERHSAIGYIACTGVALIALGLELNQLVA